MNKITVGIADLNVCKAPDQLVTYALGSCVGICLYDSTVHVAGMSHILLPNSRDVAGGAGGSPHKFADTAIVELVRNMERLGASKARIRAKIAGGAQMFGGGGMSSIGNIGARNVTAVKNALNELRIPIIAEDTGKDFGRTVYFDGANGVMTVKSATKGEWSL